MVLPNDYCLIRITPFKFYFTNNIRKIIYNMMVILIMNKMLMVMIVNIPGKSMRFVPQIPFMLNLM